jgi:6-phosphogluconolactonase
MAQYARRLNEMSDKKIKTFPTVNELNEFAANEFVNLSRSAIEERGIFSVALSGGSTPKKLFTLLASDKFRAQINWQKTYIFFGDERAVPPDDEESNYRMANETLLSKVDIPAENIHRFQTESYSKKDFIEHTDGGGFGRFQAETKVVAEIAAKMSRRITNIFHLEAGELPRFDLIFLGMGGDGHTASLFPDSDALKEKEKIVTENYVEKFDSFRLTFTFPTINNARNVIFLIAGEDKAEVLKKVLESEQTKYPSQMIQPTDGNLLFLLDEKAAAKLG